MQKLYLIKNHRTLSDFITKIHKFPSIFSSKVILNCPYIVAQKKIVST